MYWYVSLVRSVCDILSNPELPWETQPRSLSPLAHGRRGDELLPDLCSANAYTLVTRSPWHLMVGDRLPQAIQELSLLGYGCFFIGSR
ncbi:hypothetical protein Q31a_35740 [Aureliella helgolandensis]|uniref:Uncharacterized protein n=1 Tax=Aureliella helgolandensis TaxID=2527968 RepID=A0A518G9I7_9BACT|nr:hypothetical protein Q31a_35740 [Aureliella helgolandensis]